MDVDIVRTTTAEHGGVASQKTVGYYGIRQSEKYHFRSQSHEKLVWRRSLVETRLICVSKKKRHIYQVTRWLNELTSKKHNKMYEFNVFSRPFKAIMPNTICLKIIIIYLVNFVEIYEVSSSTWWTVIDVVESKSKK